MARNSRVVRRFFQPLFFMLMHRCCFVVLQADGSPASDKRVTIRSCGQWAFGLTNSNGQVQLQVSADSWTVIIDGRSIYSGNLGIDALRL